MIGGVGAVHVAVPDAVNHADDVNTLSCYYCCCLYAPDTATAPAPWYWTAVERLSRTYDAFKFASACACSCACVCA